MSIPRRSLNLITRPPKGYGWARVWVIAEGWLKDGRYQMDLRFTTGRWKKPVKTKIVGP